MRVIAGSARGLRLKTPKGDKTRPTADRVKESLFSILGDRVIDATLLDLFAGTGSLGIEALSRGAKRALFIEGDRAVARILSENLQMCKLDAVASVIVGRVPPRRSLPGGWSPFDLVLMDPPYELGLVRPTLDWLADEGLVATGGWIVVEHGAKEDMPSRLKNLTLVRTKEFNGTIVSFLESG